MFDKLGDYYNEQQAELVRQSRENEILKVRVGSFLYGTQGSTSDVDYYSIWIPSQDMVLGLKAIEQIHETGMENGRKFEITRYPLHLITRHALKNNPNILEIFYADKSNIINSTQIGEYFRSSVNLFLSAETSYKTFRGYAFEQRKKLTFKRERLEGFGKALKKIQEWKNQGLVVLPEQLNIESTLNDKGFWRNYEKGFDIETTFNSVSATLEEYGWRKELVAKYGHDTKFASHLIRILSECFDLFHYGHIRLPLNCKNDIQDIKNGKWTLQQVIEASHEWEKRIDEAYRTTKIPQQSDFKAVNDLLINMTKTFWADKWQDRLLDEPEEMVKI